LAIEKSAEESFQKALETILGRSKPEGGFAQKEGGVFRPDATAWAVMAMSRMRAYRQIVDGACRRMALGQLPDGRVPLVEGMDAAWWPTPLALLAWMKAGGFEKEAAAAENFLLATSGRHYPKEKDTPAGHDTLIRGWSWIEDTHSWIEPTAMSIIALKATGNGRHGRIEEAMKMMLNRQLSNGGWNYGNTTVFGQELLPMPEHTGQALCALSGHAQTTEVQKSIDYLKDRLPVLSTPLSLCWGLFGLNAWSIEVPDFRPLILKAFALQNKFGDYDTTLLAQLAIAYSSDGDFSGFLNG
jgi:hypothetical protein